MVKRIFRKSALTGASWRARATKPAWPAGRQSATNLTGDKENFRHFVHSLFRPITPSPSFTNRLKYIKKGRVKMWSGVIFVTCIIYANKIITVRIMYSEHSSIHKPRDFIFYALHHAISSAG